MGSAMFFSHGAPSSARLIGAAFLAFTALIAVFVMIQDAETAHEALPGYQHRPLRMRISQQLQNYDMAIKSVDSGIARSKLELVSQSQKLNQATQLAVALHNKLVKDHQSLLAEAARSRAMKQLRNQLAAKQNNVASERQKLQVEALQLAEVEQRARVLLSPKYMPAQAELQAVAQEVNISPPPPLNMMQIAGSSQQ